MNPVKGSGGRVESQAAQTQVQMQTQMQLLRQRRGWLASMGEAQDRDDFLAMATFGLKAGRACRQLGELGEAQWHLQLNDRALVRMAAGVQRLALEAEQVAETIELADAWADQDEPDQTRRLRDRARDLCFTMVQEARRLDSPVQRVACQMRIATLLSRLGDESDAQALRQQASSRGVRAPA